MIKAVLIDIDNTLLDFNKSAGKAIEMSFNRHGLPFTDTTFRDFKTINDGLWKKIELGEMTRADLHRDRFNIVLDKLGIDFDGHIIEDEFLENLFNCAILVDGALDAVKYLSSKYTLCTASNAIYLQQINRLTISGLLPYIKEVFVSEKLGETKPNRAFFDKCFEILGNVSPDEAVMIGDSLSADIAGGKNYGMKTVLFNFDKVAVDSSVADYVIDNLSEIKNIL